MREVDETLTERRARTLFRAGDVNDVLLRFNPIPNTSAAFRRDVVLGLGGYDPRYRYAMEYDLWLRVADTHVVHALDEPLSTRRMSTTNVASRAQREQQLEAVRIVAAHPAPAPHPARRGRAGGPARRDARAGRAQARATAARRVRRP